MHQLNPILRATLDSPLNSYMLIGDEIETLTQALTFGAMLKCHDGGCLSCDVCKQALDRQHPDVVVFERSGPYLSAEDARNIVTLSKRTSKTGGYLVIIVSEIHLAADAAPILLKTVEEPPQTTIIFLLTTHLEPKLDTLKSRCVQIRIKHNHVSEYQTDTSSSKIIQNLDGTPVGITHAVEDYFSNIEANIAALKAAQQIDLDEFKNSVQMQGKGNSTLLKLFEEQQKRQLRKARNSSQKQILLGLQNEIMSTVTENIKLNLRNTVDVGGRLKAVDRINLYLKNLDRNPNDNLQITALFIDLSQIFA